MRCMSSVCCPVDSAADQAARARHVLSLIVLATVGCHGLS